MTYEKIFPESIDILGSAWKIIVKKYNDDPYFKEKSACGYCSNPTRVIVVVDESTYPGSENESEEYIINSMKWTLRHEIAHAFIHESGLDDSSLVYNNGWAKNEEMIDWMALQGPKLFKAWSDAFCLEGMGLEEWIKKEEIQNGI